MKRRNPHSLVFRPPLDVPLLTPSSFTPPFPVVPSFDAVTRQGRRILCSSNAFSESPPPRFGLSLNPPAFFHPEVKDTPPLRPHQRNSHHFESPLDFVGFFQSMDRLSSPLRESMAAFFPRRPSEMCDGPSFCHVFHLRFVFPDFLLARLSVNFPSS